MLLEHERLAGEQVDRVMAKYGARYNNDVYLAATQGMSTEDANLLIDDALAMCGSPFYKLSETRWEPEALEFLKLFA